jgi:hypothetical protein
MYVSYIRKQRRAFKIAVDELNQIQALSFHLVVVLEGRHLWRGLRQITIVHDEEHVKKYLAAPTYSNNL